MDEEEPWIVVYLKSGDSYNNASVSGYGTETEVFGKT